VKPGLLPAAVAGIVLIVSLVLGVAAWNHGDVLVGVFLGVIALLSLVQVTYHFRRVMRG
jgi:hypothetical protein